MKISDAVERDTKYVGDPDADEEVYRNVHEVPTDEYEMVTNWLDQADLSLSNSRVKPIPLTRARTYVNRYHWYPWPGFTEFALGHFFDIGPFDDRVYGGPTWQRVPPDRQRWGNIGGVITFGHSGRSAVAWSQTMADRKTIELQRGVSLWWTPENAASFMVSWACKWLNRKTKYDTVTATTDPEIDAIGTIYQACNFKYLGKGVGGGDEAELRYYEIDGERVHPRTLYNRFGTSSWDFLKDHFGDRIEKVHVPAKHRYAYALDGAELDVETKPYPKREDGAGKSEMEQVRQRHEG